MYYFNDVECEEENYGIVYICVGLLFLDVGVVLRLILFGFLIVKRGFFLVVRVGSFCLGCIKCLRLWKLIV